MSAAACKEESCALRSLQMTRPGCKLRGTVEAFLSPANREAFDKAEPELQREIIVALDTHFNRQEALDDECDTIFSKLQERLRS